MTPEVARKMWRTLEPYHGLVYFAPEAAAAYERVGITGFDGYFASRAAAMGPVSAALVTSTFYNFHPGAVAHAIPAVWSITTPERILAAREEGINAALPRAAGATVTTDQAIGRAAELATIAARAANVDGRPLAAAHQSLAWPAPNHLVLWHAITILREHRGDGHVAALIDHEISGVEALILHGASGEVPSEVLRVSRQWPIEDWNNTVARLQDRGLVDSMGAFTDAGRQLRSDIEAATDVAAAQPWEVLGINACHELRNLVRPYSKAIVASGSLGFK